MHPEHRLSTPTGAESVSNDDVLSYDNLLRLAEFTMMVVYANNPNNFLPLLYLA